MAKLFGTDGVRGIANRELTCELAMKIGKAVALIFAKNCKHKPKILIGKDTRISSDMLESALVAGICSVGVDSICLGIVPTPSVSFLIKKYKANAGIMISASHNSFEFNGIKIFDKHGLKLPDNIEQEIENLIMDSSNFRVPMGEKIGRIDYCRNAVEDYVDFLCMAKENINKDLKIVVDCANGSASATAKYLFNKIDLKADILHCNPNGVNINNGCGSTHIENLSEYVTKNGYDIGIAFDGDADRCLCVDEMGKVIDGDAILAICAQDMKKRGNLKNDTLVGTMMSNLGLKKFCEENKINFFDTKVGDRYVLEKMQQGDYNLGGEQSGHIVFKDHISTGDGQLTAVKILNILSNSNRKSSELNNIIKRYPQKCSTININQNQRGLLTESVIIGNYLDDIKKKLDNSGRVVVRESGTEPKIRIMVEHEDENISIKLLNDTIKVVSENLNK